MVKIYTKGGDKGETSLFSGKRVKKCDPLVEAYGTVDELNSVLGVARSLHTEPGRLAEILQGIQHELFDCGADFASGEPRAARISDENVERFERIIDELEAGLSPLSHFILPAGHPVAAQLHHARTVCRRAERMAVAAAEHVEFDPVLIRYLNRLADLFFVLAREANRVYGVLDKSWTKPEERTDLEGLVSR